MSIVEERREKKRERERHQRDVSNSVVKFDWIDWDGSNPPGQKSIPCPSATLSTWSRSLLH